MTTLENSPAIVHADANRPVLTATAVSGSRGRTNNDAHVQTGTMFKVQAHVTSDHEIVMVMEFETSELVRGAEADNDNAAGRSSVCTLTHQSTVQLASGDALLVCTMVSKPSATSGHSYLVVTARLRDTPAERSVAQQLRLRRSGGVFGFGERPTAELVERIVRDSFQRADRDGNGILSGDELDTPTTGADKADTDESGEVTFEEFKKHISARVRPGDSANPSEEMQPTLRSQQSKKRSSSLDQRYLMYSSAVIKKYDLDGDSKLSPDEWSEMSNDPSAADKNKDGFITALELTAWSRRK